MKKLLYLLLFALIMQSYWDDDDDGNVCAKDNPSGADDCEKLNAGEGYHCCFWESEYKGQTSKVCAPVSNADYDDIKDYISKLEDKAEDDDAELSIDCISDYITISLLSLILIFL